MIEIPIGTKGQFALLVQTEHLANRFKDSVLPRPGDTGDDHGDGERGA